MVENQGAKQIYGKLAVCDMPLTITFLNPPEDEEGTNFSSPAASPAPKESEPERKELEKPNVMDPVMSGSSSESDGVGDGMVMAVAMGNHERQITDSVPPSPDVPESSPPNAVPPPVNPAEANKPPAPPVPDGDDDPFQPIGPSPNLFPEAPTPGGPDDDDDDGNHGNDGDGNGKKAEPKKSIMTAAQDLIPQVFDDDDEVNKQGTEHAE